VTSCGSVTNLNVVPGMGDHAFALKTVADAANLRSHLVAQMERAEVTADATRRRWHLTVLVVGGGYSGVEAAGEINDLFCGSARYYRNWQRPDARVVLLHAGAQILPEISPGLREFARRKMERAGVQILLSARVASATAEGVGLESGLFLKGATIVCTIGNSAAPVITGLEAAKEKNRLATEPDMRLRGRQDVWAIGDCTVAANAIREYRLKSLPVVAQKDSRQVAGCIPVRRLMAFVLKESRISQGAAETAASLAA
jgi:NADH:ubiquinone reductase (H+-translocating)